MKRWLTVPDTEREGNLPPGYCPVTESQVRTSPGPVTWETNVTDGTRISTLLNLPICTQPHPSPSLTFMLQLRNAAPFSKRANHSVQFLRSTGDTVDPHSYCSLLTRLLASPGLRVYPDSFKRAEETALCESVNRSLCAAARMTTSG